MFSHLRTMNTVSKVKVISSSLRAEKSALLSAGSPVTSGIASPRRARSIPSRITKYPFPPASTTPAFFRTGFISMVWARVSWPARMASCSTYSTLLHS